MYDFLIVGAGLFGSTFAHEAKLRGKKCLVIDKRNHIGGNCYTKKENGIDVHVYGPHIFHTSNKKIWDYINQFSSFNNFVNRPKSRIGNQIFSFPINLMTLHQLWGVTNPQEALKKLNEVKIPCENPRNLEEWILAQVGQEIYEKFIFGYTKKQWKKDPSELPSSIIRRIPIRLNYDDNYFNDPYQGIPTNGYTSIFEKMLEGCELKLNVDFFSEKNLLKKICKKIVYTGKIDEYFDYSHGILQYRSLEFKNEWHDTDFQGNAIVNYPEYHVPWTRITEHRHFTPSNEFDNSKTIITKEYPIELDVNSTPYYPIGDDLNLEIFKIYKKMSENLPDVIFGGRLAEYKYYDMHQVIASALHTIKKELG